MNASALLEQAAVVVCGSGDSRVSLPLDVLVETIAQAAKFLPSGNVMVASAGISRTWPVVANSENLAGLEQRLSCVDASPVRIRAGSAPALVQLAAQAARFAPGRFLIAIDWAWPFAYREERRAQELVELADRYCDTSQAGVADEQHRLGVFDRDKLRAAMRSLAAPHAAVDWIRLPDTTPGCVSNHAEFMRWKNQQAGLGADTNW